MAEEFFQVEDRDIPRGFQVWFVKGFELVGKWVGDELSVHHFLGAMIQKNKKKRKEGQSRTTERRKKKK